MLYNCKNMCLMSYFITKNQKYFQNLDNFRVFFFSGSARASGNFDLFSYRSSLLPLFLHCSGRSCVWTDGKIPQRAENSSLHLVRSVWSWKVSHYFSRIFFCSGIFSYTIRGQYNVMFHI